MKINKIAVSLITAGVMATPFAYATNGMNFAGYGPVSESMGGVSMAYDNGTAAIINNPATLGLMASGTSRMDVALGDLMPLATSQGVDSSAKNFVMPALGYARKVDQLVFGIGVMAQGGMGTDYSNGHMWGNMSGFGALAGSTPLLTSAQNLRNMSEVGVGRVMFPVSYSVSPDLNIGGSIDYVWAGMDAKWLIDGAHFADMVTAFGGAQTFGTASGSMINAMGAAGVNGLAYGYINFEKSGSIRQDAKATGYAGNIGLTYKVSPVLTIGGVYHSKTSLGDMQTGNSNASMTFGANIGAGPAFTQTVTGKVTIHNFQWPETYGIGAAYQANAQWMLMADYKRIGWASVFKNLDMTFNADGNAANGGFANSSVDIKYYQNWKDQDVIQLGAAYKYSDSATLRFGGNFANNPIPDAYVSPLFPAIMKTHYTIGGGYKLAKNDSVDASFVYAPKVTATNNWGAVGGSNQTVSLGGYGWQLMYSHTY